MSPSRRRRLTVTLSVFAVALYTLFCAFAPLPAPTVKLAAAASKHYTTTTAPLTSWLQNVGEPQVALSYGDSKEIWANSQDARSLASVTKLITALVGLEKQPLQAGEAGPTHTWDSTDQKIQDEFIAQNGVVFPVEIGTEIPVHLMLEIALIGSGNDFATAYAAQSIGTGTEFRAAVAEWAKKHGISRLNIYEPSGMDERNKASATDIVRVAKLALQNPVIAEIVSKRSVTLPWNGQVVKNTNPLLHMLPDIAGLKTGYTDTAGYNLAAAQHVKVGDRTLTLYATTLGAESSAQRRELTASALQTLAGAVQQQTIVRKGEVIAHATTIDDRKLTFRATDTVRAVLTPGESAARSTKLDADLRGRARGERVGYITVTTPTGKQRVKVISSGSTEDPGFWWRLSHPLKLLP